MNMVGQQYNFYTYFYNTIQYTVNLQLCWTSLCSDFPLNV